MNTGTGDDEVDSLQSLLSSLLFYDSRRVLAAAFQIFNYHTSHKILMLHMFSSTPNALSFSFILYSLLNAGDVLTIAAVISATLLPLILPTSVPASPPAVTIANVVASLRPRGSPLMWWATLKFTGSDTRRWKSSCRWRIPRWC